MFARFFNGIGGRIIAGAAVAGFVVGGGYSVYLHEQSLAQPVIEVVKLDTQAANLASNILPSKFKSVTPASKKNPSVSVSAVVAVAPALSPGKVPASAPIPVVVPPPNIVRLRETAATSAPQPPPASSPAPAPTQAPVNTPAPEQAPTPPANTEPTPPPAPPALPARVLISEILFNPAGSDMGKEFVELYNAGGTDADLKNWSLIIQNATSSPTGSSLAKLGSKPEDIVIIKAHGFLLIGLNGYNQSPSGDVVRSASMVNTSSTIYLKDNSSPQMQIDAVSYDGATPEGDSVARDNYSGVFQVQTTPTPQNSQS